MITKFKCINCNQTKVENWSDKETDNIFLCNECRERLNPGALEDGFFPPPWNFYEHPEKTEGWIEFQRAMRKDPQYYLQGCDSPNSENK